MTTMKKMNSTKTPRPLELEGFDLDHVTVTIERDLLYKVVNRRGISALDGVTGDPTWVDGMSFWDMYCLLELADEVDVQMGDSLDPRLVAALPDAARLLAVFKYNDSKRATEDMLLVAGRLMYDNRTPTLTDWEEELLER